MRRCCEQAPDCECDLQEDDSPVLLPSPTDEEVPLSELPQQPPRTPYWVTFNTSKTQRLCTGSFSTVTCVINEIICLLFSVAQRRFSTYLWLLLGFPPLAVIHSLACFFSWILVFTIPVSKMNARTMSVILLLPPEDVFVSACSQRMVRRGYITQHPQHVRLER